MKFLVTMSFDFLKYIILCFNPCVRGSKTEALGKARFGWGMSGYVGFYVWDPSCSLALLDTSCEKIPVLYSVPYVIDGV